MRLLYQYWMGRDVPHYKYVEKELDQTWNGLFIEVFLILGALM